MANTISNISFNAIPYEIADEHARTKNTEQDTKIDELNETLGDITPLLTYGNNIVEIINYILKNGSTPTPPVETDGDFDVLIVAGQSNAVCYSGANGASLDVTVPSGVFEYRPSKNSIQPFANPVGEAPSNAGVSMGYTTGGTWFSSLAKTYVESTGRKLCIIPAGNPGVTSSSYYNGASNFNMMMSKYNSFKAWYEGQSEYELGRVMLVWHQGESGTGDSNNMKVSTKKVFDDFKAAIPEIDQIFYCRISQNDACNNSTTKAYNTLFKELNDETDYCMVSANAMKYYWLNQFADVHHYDQISDNDLGAEIGRNIVMYYAQGRVKPDTKPFELDRTHAFTEFSGLTITNNKLCHFKDCTEDKQWALGSSLYASYAEISPLALKNGGTFDLSFRLLRGDKEGTALSPVLGGNGSIQIDASKVVVSDGTNSVELSHNVTPFITRGGNTTKNAPRHKYAIKLESGNLVLSVDDTQKDSKPLPAGFNASFNLLCKHGSSYLEGIISEFAVAAEAGEPVDPPTPTTFEYLDEVKGTVMTGINTINEDGVLVIDGTNQGKNLLDKPLVLTTSETWEIACDFKASQLGALGYVTFFGSSTTDSSKLVAIQICSEHLRLYNAMETSNQSKEIPIAATVDANNRHTVKIASDGTGKVYVQVDNGQVFSELVGTRTVANCTMVGDSEFDGGLQGHKAEYYSLTVKPTTTITSGGSEPEPTVTFDYLDEVKGTTFVSPKTVNEDGDIVITENDTPAQENGLNQILELLGTEQWQIETEFTPTSFGNYGYFTILGTNNSYTDGIYAMQIGFSKIRFYMNREFEVDHNLNLELNVRHTAVLKCNGADVIEVTIDSNPMFTVELPTEHNHIAVKCGVIGQSFFEDGNMSHAGKLHKLHIKRV